MEVSGERAMDLIEGKMNRNGQVLTQPSCVFPPMAFALRNRLDMGRDGPVNNDEAGVNQI